MAILVNGERVPDEVLEEEIRRFRVKPEFQSIADEAERARRIRDAAETSAIDRVLLRQEAGKDSSPVEPEAINRELERLRGLTGCRTGVSEQVLRQSLELHIRFHRAARALIGPIPRPAPHAVRQAYEQNRPSFRLPEEVHAAHIVRHIDEHRSIRRPTELGVSHTLRLPHRRGAREETGAPRCIRGSGPGRRAAVDGHGGALGSEARV